MVSRGRNLSLRKFFAAIVAVLLLTGLFAGSNYARGQALQAKWAAAAQQSPGHDPVQWWLSRDRNAEKTHKALFPGVDLTYIYDDSGLNAVLTLSPRTSLKVIQLQFDDRQAFAIDGTGGAAFLTALGSFQLTSPELYQTINGLDIPISGGYQQSATGTLGFWSANYDSQQPLQIRFRLEVVKQQTVAPSPGAPQVVAITATKTDALFTDNNGNTKADPGDTLQYTVTVTNSGDEDATGVVFNDTIDANTTLVPGSVDTTPIAVPDTYNAVGNIRIQVPDTSGLLTNDIEADGTGGLTITPQSITSANGGDVTINADGSFAFNPAPGFEGTDTFAYTLNDGEGNTDTGTVTITVAGMIWFIDNNTAPALQDGRLTNPFNSIAQFNTNAADDPGDNIFIYESTVNFYPGPITILNSQRLIGQDSTSSLSAITGITPPPFSDPFPVTDSANGIVAQIESAGTSITLAQNNTLNGFTVGNSTTAISGTAFGTLTVADVRINTNGQAMNLNTGTAAGSGFVLVNSTGGTNNLSLIALSGTLNLGTGALSGATSHAFSVDQGTASITYNGTIGNSTARSVSVTNKTGGTVTFGGAVSGTNQGVFLNSNTGATINFTGGMNLSTGANAAFTATGGGTVNATQNNTTIINTLTTTTGTALNVANTTIGASGLTFRTISANGATNGIVLANTGAGNFSITGSGDTTQGGNSSGGIIQNTGAAGISLTNVTNVSLNNMNIHNTFRSGIDGTLVNGFTFSNGTIDRSGLDNALNPVDTGLGSVNVSNIGFNDISSGVNNLTGPVTINNNILTNAFYHGFDSYNESGTITDLIVTNNVLTGTGNDASSKGSAIHLDANGSPSSGAAVTKATVTNNTINNFSSGVGIQIQGGNGALGPGVTLGIPGSGTDIINISTNTIGASSITGGIGSNGILSGVSGTGQGKFSITNNGTAGVPIQHFEGIGIAVFSGNLANVVAIIQNNFIDASDNIASSSGMSVGMQLSPGQKGNISASITGNTINGMEGNGILAGVVNSGSAAPNQSTGSFIIQNNTVGMPQGGVRPGIRVESGSTNGDTNICIDISNNISSGSGGTQGIGLRKQGTVTTVNTFGIVGLTPSPAGTPDVENYVNSLNPNGNGTLLISATSGFVSCPPFSVAFLDEKDLDLLGQQDVLLAKSSKKSDASTISSKPEVYQSSRYAKTLRNPATLTAALKTRGKERSSEVVPVSGQARLESEERESNAPSSGETINLTIGTLPFGKSITVRFRATIDSPFPQGDADVCNQATISGSNFSNVLSDDPDVGGAADPTCTTLAQADLSITKSDSPDPVPVGSNITYTIDFENLGPDGATNVVVSDAVPADTTFVSAAVTSGTGWTPATPPVGGTGTVTFSKAAVAASETATFEIVVQTNSGLPDGTIISNTAAATSETPDGDINNNTDTETTLVQAPADIAVTKTDTPDPVIAGNNITYTISFVNNGPNASNNVSVTDDVPAGTTFVSATVTSGTGWSTTAPPVGGTGTVEFTKGLVATSETATFEIVVNVPPTTADATIITNTVNATATTLDDVPGNNTDTETTTVQSRADLAVTKSDSPDPVVAGTNLTYTIDFVNNGPSTANAVSVSDPLPAGTTFVSATAPAGWTTITPPVGGTGTVTFTKATVAPAEAAAFTIVVNVNASVANGTIITNSATATSTTQDQTPGNNTGTATTTVSAQADLSITKSDTPDPVDAGANITYTLDFANIGPSDAQAVSITDATPANTTFVSATAPAGWTSTTPSVGGTGTITFTKPTTAAGETAQFTIVVNVDSDTADGATISNTADVTSATTDPNSANNTDTETTAVVTSADLSITKTDSPDPVSAGTDLTYTINLTNNGPSDAQDVSITDSVPANTTFVSATAPAGWTTTTPPVGGTGTITFEKTPVVAGEAAQFTIVVAIASNIPDGTILTNTATATTTTTDPNAANNTDTETTSVGASADLAVTKTDSVDPATAGQNLTYTISFVSNGPSDAQNVQIDDPLPANTTFVSAAQTSGPSWTITTPPVGGTGTVTFTRATVLPGETATFDLTVNVDASTPDNTILSNTVTVTSDATDPNPGDNSDTEDTLVREPSDLSITKTDGVTDITPGQSITYTIVASNAGPRDDPAAVVEDDLPAEILNVTWSCVGSGGATCTSSGNGDINETVNLPAGGSVTFTVQGVVDFGAINLLENTATVTPGPGIVDPDPSNNTATDTDTITCLFCDEFDDSTLDANWTYKKSINLWSEDGNNLIGSNTRKASALASPVFAGCATCTIFTTMQTAGGAFNRVWLQGWVIDNDNNVELLMKQESGTWVLKQRVAGAIVAKQKVKLPILPNTVYNIRITFDGTNFQVFIDGALAITLPAVQAPSGTVGFKVKGTTGTFDFIRVF